MYLCIIYIMIPLYCFVFIFPFPLPPPPTSLSSLTPPTPRSDHSFLIFYWGSSLCSLCMWWWFCYVNDWKREALTLLFCDHLILFLFSGYHILGSSCSFSFALFFFSLSTIWTKICLLCCFWQTSSDILQRQMNLCEVIIKLMITLHVSWRLGNWLVSKHQTNFA